MVLARASKYGRRYRSSKKIPVDQAFRILRIFSSRLVSSRCTTHARMRFVGQVGNLFDFRARSLPVLSRFPSARRLSALIPTPRIPSGKRECDPPVARHFPRHEIQFRPIPRRLLTALLRPPSYHRRIKRGLRNGEPRRGLEIGGDGVYTGCPTEYVAATRSR